MWGYEWLTTIGINNYEIFYLRIGDKLINYLS